MAERRWFVRLDPGWSARDVRFYGDRWCKADLLTVTENHGGGKLLTRLRLRVQPTLYHSALVLLLGYVLTLLWFLDGRWALAFAPFLAAAGWWLSASRRRLRATVNACVLAVAEDLGMSVVGAPGLLGRDALERLDPAAEEGLAGAEALAEGAGGSGRRARLGL